MSAPEAAATARVRRELENLRDRAGWLSEKHGAGDMREEYLAQSRLYARALACMELAPVQPLACGCQWALAMTEDGPGHMTLIIRLERSGAGCDNAHARLPGIVAGLRPAHD